MNPTDLKSLATPLLTLSIIYSLSAQNDKLSDFIDIQMQPTMHIPYSFFWDGFKFFDEKKPPYLKHQQMFNNVNYVN